MKNSTFLARLLIVFLSLLLLCGCSENAPASAESVPINIPLQKLEHISWEDTNSISNTLCFSPEEILFLRSIGAWGEVGHSEICRFSFEDGSRQILAKRDEFLSYLDRYDGEKVFTLGPVRQEKWSFASTDLATGSTEYAPFEPAGVSYNSPRLLPCQTGYTLLFEEFPKNEKVYRICMYTEDSGNVTESVLVKGVIDMTKVIGKGFIADIAPSKNTDKIWLLCEDRTPKLSQPYLEIYDMNGKFLETRELPFWNEVTKEIEISCELPYEVGAKEIVVLGEKSEYLLINFQTSSRLFLWKNGEYQHLGSPAVLQENETLPIHTLVTIETRCSGCIHSSSNTRFRYFYEKISNDKPLILYIFDSASGQFYYTELPNYDGGVYIDSNCNGDLLLRCYEWQDYAAILTDGYLLLREDIERAIALL